MKKQTENKTGRSLTMARIFRCMMEEGHYPIYETSHIVFGLDDNLAIVEYEEGVLSVRLFFSIEEDMYPLFLEASNWTMMTTFAVKPVVLDDMKNLMFSCETLCDNIREFRKFFPRSIDLIREALNRHRAEMKKTIPAKDEYQSSAGTVKSNKVVS